MQYAITGFRRLEPVTLSVQAASAQEARDTAIAQGVAVHAVRIAAPWSRAWRLSASPSFPLLPFTQSLAILLQAGLTLVEGIETLAQRETRAEVRRVLATVAEQLEQGLPFSTALERQPAAFPSLYVAMMRANERTGGLVDAMTRFASYRTQVELVRKRVIGASIYPAMILIVGLLVVGFLLAYVVPRFSVVFQDLGDRVPYPSLLLLRWGHFAHDHAALLLAAGTAIVAAAAVALSRQRVRLVLLRLLQRLPRVGEMLRVFQLARFYRALGMLLEAGIALPAALNMMTGLLPASLQASLAAARLDVMRGRALSSALETHGLTTLVALRLLRVAERTGRMGEMLQRCASFHDDEVAQAIDWFVRLFEPLLMIAIGIVIGVVVLLMYAPIFELAGSLQ